jgi:8-oxo-dGTP pyrophosphatase MutT (NUDIX family)
MLSEPGPWRVAASRRVLKDRWIDLRADACVDARGNVLDPYYVLGYGDWVQVVALTEADELVLVRQYRHAVGAVCLELPGGVMDPGEADPVAAGLRELAEETGYAAPAARLVASLRPNTATHTNHCHSVLAMDARLVGATAHEPGEDITTVLLPLAEALPRLAAGLLPQAMHVSALLLALAAAGRIDLTPR